MESIFKAFLGTFLILALVISGVTLLYSSLTARSADSFMTETVQRIENSNFDQNVIDECVSNASRRNYSLNVKLYAQNGSSMTSFGQAELRYPFALPMMTKNRTQVITAELR